MLSFSCFRAFFLKFVWEKRLCLWVKYQSFAAQCFLPLCFVFQRAEKERHLSAFLFGIRKEETADSATSPDEGVESGRKLLSDKYHFFEYSFCFFFWFMSWREKSLELHNPMHIPVIQKNLPVKGRCGRCSYCLRPPPPLLGPNTPPPPPPHTIHTVYVNTVYLFTQGRG